MQGEVAISDAFEEWRDIKGYEGRYQVSNLGRVRSLDRVTIKSDGVVQHSKGRVLKPYLACTGYLGVRIEDGKHITIHRAVAEAFLPRVDGKNVVNHISGIRTENTLSNLEWTTFSGNTRHAVYVTKNIKKQLFHPMRKVMCIDTGKVYDSLALAARATGALQQNIWHVCQGHWTKTAGLRWRYADGTKC